MPLVQKGSPRRQHIWRIPRHERMLVLHGQQIDIALPGDVKGMPLRAEKRAVRLMERLSAQGTDEIVAMKIFYQCMIQSVSCFL